MLQAEVNLVYEVTKDYYMHMHNFFLLQVLLSFTTRKLIWAWYCIHLSHKNIIDWSCQDHILNNINPKIMSVNWWPKQVFIPEIEIAAGV